MVNVNSYIVTFVSICFALVICEYHVKRGSIPSLLRRTFLYSIDKNNNQLIIQLSKGISPKISIQFRGEQTDISLQILCHCSQCLYNPLFISLSIDKEILLECNGYRYDSPIKYSEKFLVNRDYPVYVFKKSVSGNTAILSLVNTETYGNAEPNPEQLQGCIFSIKYNANEITGMDRFGGAVQNACVKVCKENICNGGVCYETYSKEPICDCMNSFGSGYLCLDESKSINRIYRQSFQFYSIKISWRTDQLNIFELRNRLEQVKVFSVGTKWYLNYNISEGTNNEQVLKALLVKSDQRNEPCVLILKFGTELSYQMNDNRVRRMSKRNANDKTFDYLMLSSGVGVIDIVYKSFESDVVWRQLPLDDDLSEIVPFPLPTPKAPDPSLGVTSDNMIRQTNTGYFIAIYVLLAIILLLLAAFSTWTVFSFRKHFVPRKQRDSIPGHNTHRPGTEHIPLNDANNEESPLFQTMRALVEYRGRPAAGGAETERIPSS